MSTRARTPAIAVLLALGFAGCGGGGGDPSAFATATDRTCRELTGAVSTLRDGLVRTDASTEGDGLGSALSSYAKRVRSSADRLAATNPPKADAAFRDAAVKGLRHHAEVMRDAAVQARRGRMSTGLAGELRGAELPTIPSSVLQDAPDCRRTAS